MKWLAISSGLFLFASSALADLQTREGYAQIDGGKVWYKIVSNPKTSHRPPLIVLHGGPGAPHNYLLPLTALAEEHPVLFYDQLGCGKSMDYDKIRTDLWSVERFTKELAQLIDHLGYSRVHLFGHSWGTSLALEYYLEHPFKVASMIFEGAFFSSELWERDAWFLRRLLPPETQAVLNRYEERGEFDNPEYLAAVEVYYHRHLNRQDPWPQVLLDTFAGLGTEVYQAMVGPNEFVTTGVLKTYERMEQLRRIQIPTLFLSGQFDEVQPRSVWQYSALIPLAQVKIFENSSHTPHLEEPTEFLQTTSLFLNRINLTGKIGQKCAGELK